MQLSPYTLRLTCNHPRAVQHVCTFGEVSDKVATMLIEDGEIFNCAGGLMVENELMNPFARIDGTMQSVMGLSPKLVSKLWDKMALTSERPCRRRLESSSGLEPKSTFETGNVSSDVTVIESRGIDGGDSDSDDAGDGRDSDVDGHDGGDSGDGDDTNGHGYVTDLLWRYSLNIQSPIN